MPLDPSVEFEVEEQGVDDPDGQAGRAGERVGADRDGAQGRDQAGAVVAGLGRIGRVESETGEGAAAERVCVPSRSSSSQ